VRTAGAAVTKPAAGAAVAAPVKPQKAVRTASAIILKSFIFPSFGSTFCAVDCAMVFQFGVKKFRRSIIPGADHGLDNIGAATPLPRCGSANIEK
jgi:hypothetical protein